MRKFSLVCVVFALSINLGVARAEAQDAQPKPQAPAATQPADGVPGHLIQRVDPVYPGQAKRTFVTGTVVMTATVARDGSVTDVKVVSGNTILVPAAMSAVSKWKYEPARIDGVAVAAPATITMNFTMGSNGAATSSEGTEPMLGTAAAPARALPEPPPGVMRISGRVMAGMLDKRVEPVYPADSIALDARGTVLLLATIRKTGEVSDVQVVSGPQRFRDAATAAVKQWTYHPYVVDGSPVNVQTAVALEFAPPK